MDKTITFLAKDSDKNLRLDKFLTYKLKTLTRSQIKKVIASKGVKYWLAIGRKTIAVPNPENPRTRPASKAENIIHIMPFSGSRSSIKCSATIVEPACPLRR